MASNTITTPLAERQVGGPADVIPFLNKEAIPLLREMRAALNATHVSSVSGDTSDSVGAYKQVWESQAAPTSGVWSLEARAVLADGTDGAVYKLAASFRMVSGAPTAIGSTAIVSQESTGAFDWQWSTTATTVVLSLKDAGVAATYYVVIETVEVIP